MGTKASIARTVLLAKVIVLTVTIASPANYYVAPEGDNANPGTESLPWRTIQRAVKHGYPIEYRQPGDVVFLRGGLYSGNAQGIDINGIAGAVSGTTDAPITIKAYPGELPVVCDQTSPARGVLLKNLTGWVFDGITFSNCFHSVWLENCTNIVFQNCSFGWMPQADSGYGNFVLWGFSQQNTVSNCTFLNWGKVTAEGNDHGVSISIGDSATDKPMWYNLIVSNRFFYGGHDHFQLNSGYNVIRGNVFVNAPWIPTNAACNTLASIGGVAAERNMYGAYGNRHTKPGDGSGTVQADMRNVWEGNTFLYTGPPPDDYGAFGIELGTRQSIYRFNTIAYSLAAGVFFNTSGTTSLSTSNAVYGNVLYGNGLAHQYGGEGMKSFGYGLGMSTYQNRRTNNFVVNNIIWRNLPQNVSPAILLFQQFRSNFTNNLIDPLFVSTNGWGWHYDPENVPDFRLRPGSPCIDAGTWLAYAAGDGEGTTLAVDNSLYFSDGNRVVPGDSIQLGGQTARSTVVSNDFANNVLYLSTPLSWTNGQGVSLAYIGSAPDVGAHEFDLTSVPAKPMNLRTE